jgi:hypothetical protein
MARNPLLDRLTMAGIGGLFMIPGTAACADTHDELGRLIVGLLAMMLICDWGQRIEDGRRGMVSGWSAFWPAIIGLSAAAIADASNYMWTAAGVCAAVSLLTQAAAAMWPIGQAERGGSKLPGPGPQGPPPRPQQAADETPPPPPTDAAQRIAQPAAAPPRPAQQATLAAQPSFAGRATNAGFSFLGKLLLLVGLVVAVGHGAGQQQLTHAMETGRVHVSAEVESLVHHGLPPGVVFIPLAVGGLLLVAARRRDGFKHFLRGCVGAALTILGGLMAQTVAASPLAMLFTSGEHAHMLGSHDAVGRLLITGVALGAGILLLLWPKADQNRPIVV